METHERKSTLYYILPIIIAIAMAIGILIGNWIAGNANHSSEVSIFSKKYDKFNDVLNIVAASYVDSVDKNKLTEQAISAMLQGLDPHSYYVAPSEFKELNDPLLGSFEGIGVEFNIQRDTIMVINTIAGGPSEKAGIKAGDRIVKVNDTLVAGKKITNTQVMRKLKGKKGTQVKVSVKRSNFDNLLDFIITRDKIPTYSVDIAYMVSENIGYIKISKFSSNTQDEFVEAIKKLKNEGLTKLILDLRGNGGGFLESAIQISDEFLENKKLIVYTEGRAKPTTSHYATKYGNFEKNDLVILIDEWSASASEIVAGAVQDNDRGLIVGRRSFGKGLVQEQMMLADGSAVRITIARYHTPSGRCIQKSYKNGSDEYYIDLLNRYNSGELENTDSIHFNDTTNYKTTGGRIVKGGGGIMPDVFVPIDTAENTKFFIIASNKGIVYQFAFNYADRNREQIKNRYTAKQFVNQFQISDETYRQFIEFAASNKIKADEKQIEKSKTLIKNQLKAYIGRNLFGNEAFYPVLHKSDKVMLQTIELLNKGLKFN